MGWDNFLPVLKLILAVRYDLASERKTTFIGQYLFYFFVSTLAPILPLWNHPRRINPYPIKDAFQCVPIQYCFLNWKVIIFVDYHGALTCVIFCRIYIYKNDWSFGWFSFIPKHLVVYLIDHQVGDWEAFVSRAPICDPFLIWKDGCLEYEFVTKWSFFNPQRKNREIHCLVIILLRTKYQ